MATMEEVKHSAPKTFHFLQAEMFYSLTLVSRSGKMEEFELVWQRSQRPTDADLSCFLMTDLDFPHLT
jgi:hypothetical protein